MKQSALILLFVTSQLFAQISEITRFPLQEGDRGRYGIIVHNNNDEMLFVWSENSKINLTKSSDNGISWSAKSTISDSSARDYRSVVTNSGRIILTFRSGNSNIEYCYSNDNGTTWSEIIILTTEGSSFNISKGLDNRIWLTYLKSEYQNAFHEIFYKESLDDGDSWSSSVKLWEGNNMSYYTGDLIQLDDSTLYATALIDSNDNVQALKIVAKYSYDNGTTWGDYATIFSHDSFIRTMQTFKGSENGIKIIINKLDNRYWHYKIDYIESFDNGENWSESLPFTKYLGDNFNATATERNGKIFTVFTSNRFDWYLNLWYGIIGESEDTKAPPIINSISNIPGQLGSGDTLSFRAYVLDYNEISKVTLTPTINSEIGEEIEMFDDGIHNDLEPNDGYYGATIGSFAANDTIQCSIVATDVDGNSSEKLSDKVIYEHTNKRKDYLVDVNSFKLPIDNKGVLGDVKVGAGRPSGRFDDKAVLYSGGFWLSGYKEGELWSNGIMTAGRIEHYVPGKVGIQPDDTLNMVYILRSGDKPFGNAWQTWKTAVELGAKFYDGNGDGIYNPVDLNGNEVWDENEDRPDLIGDVTTWTVYNDGVPSDLRGSYNNQGPVDIEIQQTLFAYSHESNNKLDGVIFIRYLIVNKSQTNYDSVYFSVNADIDIGNYADDLTGCDTTINSSFGYNDGEDGDYGINAPAIFTTLLQGPVVYIPGETFIDNNGNGIYEQGTDTPLDTAYNFNGEFIDTEFYEGAKNQNMTSSTNYIRSIPGQGDPYNKTLMRYYQLGLLPTGKYIDPCSEYNSTVIEEDCNSINPKYFYTGDPVKRTGWLDTRPDDMRTVFHTGPFDLEANESVEILIAYSVGRGNTELESIDVTKKIVNDVIGFYKTNFSYVPVGVNDKPKTKLPTEYSLSQNYPNPFNPSTTIKYSIPRVESGHAPTVQLKIYDILGREVATLVNTAQKPGNYEVEFDASNLTSGVYFYRLHVSTSSGQGFNQSRKMVLIK